MADCRKVIAIIILFALIVATVSACGTSYPVVKDIPSLEPSNQDFVTVVAGIQILGNLSSMLMALYVSGDMMPLKGIVSHDYPDDSVPGLTPLSVWKSARYVKADDNDQAYLVWFIPQKALDSNNRCIFFPSVIRSEEAIMGGYDGLGSLNGLPAPFSFRKAPKLPESIEKSLEEEGIDYPVWVKDDKWQFYGNIFTIQKPGIYYLGDYVIEADLRYLKEKRRTVCKVSQTSMRSDEALKKYLHQNGLKDDYHDLSASWTVIQGKDFRDYAKGRK
jgi:hypothetical protein